MDSFPSPCKRPCLGTTWTFLGPSNSACVARQITGHPEGRGVCIAPPPPTPPRCVGARVVTE